MGSVESKTATEAPAGASACADAPGAPSAFIAVSRLTARYGDVTAVRDVSFTVGRGEQLSLLGPSGCGKSTILRCIAGLETPAAGEIAIDGRIVFSSDGQVNVPPERRNLSMMFQSYAIWPHMTVFENVAYGLQIRHTPREAVRARVTEVLHLVGMERYMDAPATNLSGGQQQRIALARAYAVTPTALLLDEPLSNLDARLRVRMREELKEIQRRFGVTTVYVTHDQEEAMALSDRIIVMRDGAIVQAGAPLEIYQAPRSQFVADFVGAANILVGAATPADAGVPAVFRAGEAAVHCAAGPVPASDADGRHRLAVRTVFPRLSRTLRQGLANQWPATITRRVMLGDIVVYLVRWPGGELRVHSFPRDLLNEGETVYLHIPQEHAVLVEADG